MGTFLRIVLAGVLLVVILTAIAVGATVFIDPNQFKPTIAQLAEDQTHLWVNLEGDLTWSVFPRLSIVAHDIQADWTPDADAPFMSAKRLALGVELWPLISPEPQLQFKRLELAGLRLELQRHANGRGNWEAPVSGDAVAGADGSPRFDAWHFDRVAIADAVVRYVDLAAGETLMVHDMDIEASDVSLGEAFPLAIHLDFDLQNQATHVVMDVVTDATIDRTRTQVQLDALKVDGELRRQGLRDVPYSFSGRISSDAEKGAGTVELDEFKFGSARLKMSAKVSGLYEKPKLTGHLDLDVPETSALSEQLGIGETIFERVALVTNYDIVGQSAKLSDVELTLDDMTLTGKLELTDEEIPTLKFVLAADELPLDRYLEPVETEASTASSPTAVDAPFFERDMLPALHWDGRIKAKRAIVAGVELGDAELITHHHNGVLSNTVNIGSILEGRLRGNAKLDATTEPRWSTKVVVDHIRAQAIYKWLAFDAQIKGHFDVKGEFSATGNTPTEIANSLTGELNLDGGQGSTSIEGINEIGMAIAVLVGRGGKVKRWPDVVNYQRLLGTGHVEGMQNQRFTFYLDNFEIDGNGTYDVASDSVDYKASIVFRNKPDYNTFDVPDIFVGVAWPVRCKGHVDDESLCKIGKDAAATIPAQLLTKQLGRQLFKGVKGIIMSPKRLVKGPKKK